MKTLIVEDNQTLADLTAAALTRSAEERPIRMEITRVITLAEADAIFRNGFDLVILDLTLSDADEMRSMAWIREHYDELPAVVVVSGSLTPGIQHDCIANSGAMHFFHREELVMGRAADLALRIMAYACWRRNFERNHYATQTH